MRLSCSGTTSSPATCCSSSEQWRVGVAALAAAVAYHRVGAPLAVSLLLGLSAIVLMHGPPIGPIGLVCFATAIALLARSQRKAEGSETAAAPRAVRSSGPSEP